MTLDAMDWVWKHSQSRGNPRIALLAVADQVRTPACEVRVSYSDFMRALNVSSRTVVRDAIRVAEELGELETVEAGKGTRKALYRLPKAVGYLRSGTDSGPLEVQPPAASGPNPVPQAPVAPPASGTDSGPQGTDLDRASGTDSDPVQSGIWTASGTDSDPLYQSHSPKRERAIDTPDSSDGIPDFARPLVDGCTLAEVTVRWPFNNAEWLKVHAAIKKSGTPALIDYARRIWDRQRGDIDSARYFIRGWTELAPLPRPEAERPPLRALPAAPSAPAWPSRSTTDQRVNDGLALAARLRAIEEGHQQ